MKQYAIYLLVLFFTTGITSNSFGQFTTKQPANISLKPKVNSKVQTVGKAIPVKKETTNPTAVKTPNSKAAKSVINKSPVTKTTNDELTNSYFPEPNVIKGHTKDLPVPIGYFQYSLIHRLDAIGLQRAKTAFVNSGQFTESEWNIITQKTNISNFPAAINTVKKIADIPYGAFDKGKAYIQGSFLLPFNGVAQIIDLVWLPRGDNLELQQYLAPDGGDQYFFIVHDFIEQNTHARTRNVHSVSRSFLEEMKAKHSRSNPESMVYEPTYDYSTYHLYKPMRQLGYTEEEYIRVTELSNNYYIPKGLQYENYNKNKDELKNYKAYRITEFEDGYGIVRLYWIPKEENTHMPKDLQPLTDEGVFFFNRIKRHDENKSVSTKVYGNKPEWEIYPELYNFYSKGGTDAQAEVMAKKRDSYTKGDADNNRQMITKEQAAERDRDYTNAINSLKELDKRFEPYAEMLMRDQRTVFLTRQWRGRALSIVDTQISVVEGYLKKWEKYLAPSDLASWKYRLSQLNSMRYKI